jgi:formylglycine-generating enzyme required for sulfatase activity
MNTKHFLRAVIAILSIAFAVPASAQCTGDINNDGVVNGGDLGTQLSWWGPVVPANPVSVASDLDSNGLINGGDLGLLLSNWGPCPGSISGVTPTEGCFVGGTAITITGSYIGTATEVTIGGVLATNVTASSPTTVTATTPAGTLGPATVRVTTAAGTYTAPQTFTYMPASVTSVAPNAGITTGGYQITITGAYLALTTGVSIGGAPCTAVTVVNATTVTAMTPAGTLGNADVVITGGKGTITVVGGYRYVTVVVPSWASLVEAEPDPSVVTDVTLRSVISASGMAWRVRDTATQIEMMLVPPGDFRMGCTASNQFVCDANEIPTHSVTLTQAFYMGRYEVTQSQWVAKMGSNPSYFRGPSYPDAENRPVETVSWTTIQGYLSSTGVRLPSEAEWEYACRAGTTTAFNNGSSDDTTVGTIAWYSSNSGGQTHAVGGKAANALGLHDMAGNVWEWVNDWYAGYSSGAQTNPSGPVSGGTRVFRGGTWSGSSTYLRSSLRDGTGGPSLEGPYIGFRVARNP